MPSLAHWAGSLSGGGGNRKPPISARIRQLLGIEGNRIPGSRNQNTKKDSFGEPFLPSGKIGAERTQGRADVGDMRTLETHDVGVATAV
jgi:hypothetical protein